MKNIPMFTGTHGLATLVLREIGFSGNAYVMVRAVWNGQAAAFLQECYGFCVAVGAKAVYATWEEDLPGEPAWESIWMTRPKAGLPQGRDVDLEPLTPANGQRYLEVYNRCFRDVPAAASYDKESLRSLYGMDCAYLAKVDGKDAGVAEISKTGLEAIGVLPEFRGLGYDLALAVLPMVPATELKLKVSSTNKKALALYDRLGFAASGVEKRWWQVEKP